MNRFALLSSFTLALFTLGCGGAQSAAEEPAREVQPPQATPEPGHAPALTRSLPFGATFGDLVTRARELDEGGQGDSQAGCLLRAGGSGPMQFEADLSVAVRPLPDAAESIDALFAGNLRVLTRHGPMGDGTTGLVAFTSTPALEGPVDVLLVTRQRHEQVRVSEGDNPSARGILFVVAAADVALADVLAKAEEVLGPVVAFASPLPDDTRLPESVTAPPAPASPARDNPAPAAAECEGLSTLDASEPLGEIPVSAFSAPVTTFREAAAECPNQGAAGRHQVAFRIDARGLVSEVCVVSPEASPPEFNACVVAALERTAFPVPSPTGFVDVQFPLAIAAADPVAQQLRCR